MDLKQGILVEDSVRKQCTSKGLNRPPIFFFLLFRLFVIIIILGRETRELVLFLSLSLFFFLFCLARSLSLLLLSFFVHSTLFLMDRRLLEFIDRPVSNTFLQYLAQQASQVISCHPPTATTQLQIPPLPSFISLVVRRSNANAGTLLGTLVLLDRLRHSLTPPARGMPCTCQRIFLATLIVTHKVLHDTAPRNRHWTRYAYYFATNEINLMEKQLLMLLVKHNAWAKSRQDN